jgi:hypothetical protein
MNPPAETLSPLQSRKASDETALLQWNPSLRLWGRNSPGHTRAVASLQRVHSGVESAVRLALLAQAGRLDDGLLEASVSGLLDLQMIRGPRAGCFRWYAEENEPIDTNAAFFIGLALELLLLCEPDRFPEPLRPRTHAAIERLNTWFLLELERESPIYPNKYLGDIVCAWLGHEIIGQPAPDRLLAATERAAAYWKSSRWGWGEHMSDVYSGILLIELSALLLFSRTLPKPLRLAFHDLARELVEIDDRFGDGPRTPQIRCYDFAAAPVRTSFRSQIHTPFPEDADADWFDRRAAKRYMLLPFGPWLRSRGWDLLLPQQPVPASAELRVPLTPGFVSDSWIQNGFRSGSLSCWPMLPGTDHQQWGLSWQTFPAAFLRNDSEWGFLRFTTRVDGMLRAHPAIDKASAYLHNALGPGEPPPVGTSICRQNGPDWTAERSLPQIPGCTEMTDGFWLHGLSAAPLEESRIENSTTLLLPDPRLPLRLIHTHEPGCPAPTLEKVDAGTWKWTVSSSCGPLKNTWSIRLG